MCAFGLKVSYNIQINGKYLQKLLGNQPANDDRTVGRINLWPGRRYFNLQLFQAGAVKLIQKGGAVGQPYFFDVLAFPNQGGSGCAGKVAAKKV